MSRADNLAPTTPQKKLYSRGITERLLIMLNLLHSRQRPSPTLLKHVKSQTSGRGDTGRLVPSAHCTGSLVPGVDQGSRQMADNQERHLPRPQTKTITIVLDTLTA